MAKTTKIIAAPAPETEIGPVREYTEQQHGMIKALREVGSPTLMQPSF